MNEVFKHIEYRYSKSGKTMYINTTISNGNVKISFKNDKVVNEFEHKKVDEFYMECNNEDIIMFNNHLDYLEREMVKKDENRKAIIESEKNYIRSYMVDNLNTKAVIPKNQNLFFGRVLKFEGKDEEILFSISDMYFSKRNAYEFSTCDEGCCLINNNYPLEYFKENVIFYNRLISKIID